MIPASSGIWHEVAGCEYVEMHRNGSERSVIGLVGLVATRLLSLRETKPHHKLRFRLLRDALPDAHLDAFALRLDWTGEDDEERRITYFALFPKDGGRGHCGDSRLLCEVLRRCCAWHQDFRQWEEQMSGDARQHPSLLREFLGNDQCDFRVVLYTTEEIPKDSRGTLCSSNFPFANVFATTGGLHAVRHDDERLSFIPEALKRELSSRLVLSNAELDDLLKAALRTLLCERKQGWGRCGSVLERYLADLRRRWENVDGGMRTLLLHDSSELHEIVRGVVNSQHQAGECADAVLDRLEEQLTDSWASCVVFPHVAPSMRCHRIRRVLDRRKMRYLIVTEADLKEWRRRFLEELCWNHCDEVILCVASLEQGLQTLVERGIREGKFRMRVVSPTWTKEIHDTIESLGVHIISWTELLSTQERMRLAAMPLTRLPGSATTHGPSFEYKLAALLALRATRQGLRFRLYSNVAAARPMDDLVLRVNDPNPVTYFVQLKHAKGGSGVDTKAFLSKDGDYSLSKYYDWFCKYQQMYNHRNTLSDADEWLLTSWKMEEVRIVLYTNKKVEHTSSKSPSRHLDYPFPYEGLLRTGEEDNVFSFQKGDKAWNLIQEDSFRNEFLPRVKVLGAQAHVNELDDLIRKELDQLYGKPLMRSEKYAKEYIETFRKWAEESSRGDCITESSEEMQKIIAEDLRACAREAAQGAGLAFQEGQCPFADADCPFRALSCLRHAVARSAATLLRVPGVAAGLRAARAQQLLDRDFPGRWAYVDERSLKEFPAAALAAACSVCDVVVLDVNKATKPLKDLFDSVCAEERKCVILTDSDTVKKYLLGKRQCSEVVDDWALDQLTDEAQETFVDTALEFQGGALSLRELERAWPSVRRDVDGALLGRLAQGDAAVGAAPSWADTDALHHLPRTLAHSSRLSWDVLRLPSRADHLVLHGFSREDVEQLNAERAQEEQKEAKVPRIEQSLQERFTVLDEGITESVLMEKFEHLCSTNGRRNVHLLEKVGGSLLWRASRGNTAAVAEFVQPLTAECTPRPLCPHRPSAEQERVFESGRVQLLLGEPGIGKSSFLQRLAADARARTPSRWAVVIKLLDHDRLLDEMPAAKDMGEKDVVHLVATAAVGVAMDCKAARCSVKVALLHSGAIHVFVDGVDEVVPALETKALRLLELLMETRAERIWIASRPEVGHHLRRTVVCAPLKLLPLSRQEQVSYLTAHWTTKDADTLDAVQEVAKKMVDAFARIPGKQSEYQLARPVVLQHLLRMIIHELHNVLEPLNKEMLTTGKTNNFDDEITSIFMDVCSILILGTHLDVAFLIGETLKRLKKILEKDSYQKKVVQIIDSKQQEIVKKISESFDKEVYNLSLLAIPLHLRMAAEAYAEKVTEAVQLREDINMNNLSQLELFTHFINKKREQCKQRYGTDRPAIWDQGDNNAFYDVHQYYAMSMFSAALPDKIRRGFQQTKKEEYQKYITKDKTDILCKTENGRPQFTHISFMEYFVATWMFKKYQSLKKTSVKTLKPYLQAAFQWKTVSSVLFFFDLMLADKSPLHNAVLAGDEAALRACLASNERADRVDEAGRSALHLAASYGRAGAVLALLDSGATLELRDRLHDWTPLEYADAALELEASEQLLRRGGDPRQLVNIVRAADDTLLKAAQFDLVEIVRKMMLSEAREAIFSGFSVWEMHVNIGPENYKEQGTHKTSSSTGNRNDILTLNYIEAPIHRASVFGSEQVVEFLLKAGVNVNIRTANQRTPLHLAASQGHQEILQRLLKAGAEIDAKDDKELTPLHLAAHHFHEKVVRILILNKAAINVTTKDGRTALYLAAFKGHSVVADILLKNGAHVNLCKEGNVAPLHAAAQEGSYDVTELLLSHNADVNKGRDDGSTPLHLAAVMNQKHVAELLLRQGARVDCCTVGNFTPLHVAAQEGSCEVTELLLSHNADVNRGCVDDGTPLHLAALRNRRHVAELLLLWGACVDSCSNQNATPLHIAAQAGSWDVAELLLSHNADVNRGSADGKTPLHLAAGKNHRHVAELLLQRGARVDSCDNRNYTPLHFTAQEGSYEVAELLLFLKADVNKQEDSGCAPLHFAALNNHKPVAELLLWKGARVDSCDNHIATPLHVAAQEGSCDVVELLLSHNADVNRCSGDGSTPLHFAAGNNQRSVVELLLRRGALVNSCGYRSFSPLHVAAEAGSCDVAELLLSHKADVNRIDSSENATPLHIAAWNGRGSVVKILLEGGANVNARGVGGRTAVQLAGHRGHKETVAILVSWIAEMEQNKRSKV